MKPKDVTPCSKLSINKITFYNRRMELWADALYTLDNSMRVALWAGVYLCFWLLLSGLSWHVGQCFLKQIFPPVLDKETCKEKIKLIIICLSHNVHKFWSGFRNKCYSELNQECFSWIWEMKEIKLISYFTFQVVEECKIFVFKMFSLSLFSIYCCAKQCIWRFWSCMAKLQSD